MDEAKKQWFKKIAECVSRNLANRGFEVSWAADAIKAKEDVLTMIPDNTVVYRCGSTTVTQIGLWDALAERPNVEVINPFKEGVSAEEGFELRRKGLLADIVLCSCNAITLDGRLINVDGSGNRVAALSFGPKKVILVVGVNKIVADLKAAFDRIKNYAAPMNCIRVRAQTPCVKSGICSDCRGYERRCNKWSIIEGTKFAGRMHIKLVGESLGY